MLGRWSRDRRLGFEGLEPRLVLTWVGVPPVAVALPASAAAVTLNSAADASGAASIATTEVDYYSFTATRTGSYTISATTPSSSVDTVLGVFSSTGRRLAYNDDIVYATNTDSRLTINLTAGVRYYVGITNYSTASRGSYTWTIDGPAAVMTPTTPTSPTTPTTPTTPTSTGGFQITLSMSGLTVSQQAIFQQASARWQEIIVGDLPNATYRGQSVDDILIAASSVTIDGVNGILGQAGPDAFRSASDLPYHGIMQFDSADMASMERSGLLFSVVLHEMGHVLGVGTIWEDRGLLSGAGPSNPIFVGAHATAAYNQMFGTSARGVPVENTGGAGTADGHWRETIFVNELMTGWAGPGTNLPMSSVTVASLWDLGYTVNMAAANSYTPSSSALATARSAAAARSSSILTYNDSAVGASVFDVLDVGPSSQIGGAPWGELTRPVAVAARPDANLVDAVLAGSGTIQAEAAEDSMRPFDSGDEYDVAWDEFGLDVDLCPCARRSLTLLRLNRRRAERWSKARFPSLGRPCVRSRIRKNSGETLKSCNFSYVFETASN